MANLILKNVSKVYPSGVTALYDINLTANENEFLVVVGAEKSGKSSLLRVVSGLDEVSEGQILIGGEDMTDTDPKNRNVAVVFKGNTLYPSLNVYDNMAFGLRMRKAPQTLIDKRVKAVADILGLTDCLYRKPKQLSSFTKQKIALGRAVVREPRLYLFDEPLSGLDEGLKIELLNLIVNMQARLAGTFVYSTKNVAEAMNLGSRIIVMKNGFVQQVDTPQNLYDYPVNAYVAFYIGSPTINFIYDCKIEKSEDGAYAVFADGKIKLSEKTLSRFENIDEYVDGKTFILGIRPEDMKVAKDGELKATIEKVEEVDTVHYAECKVGKIDLVATSEPENKKGSEVTLSIDGDRVYLFDSVTRFNLLKRDEGYTVTGLPEADYIPLPYDKELEILKELAPKKEESNKKKLR